MKKEELWKQAQEDFKVEDAGRKAFLVSIKALENPKTGYERIQIAKKAIQLFMKFRSTTTKKLRVRIQAATLGKN
ncbi:MAG: hypothetical protein ABSF48_25225 [Thermodesulfobacteriota bacterium]|jgi:hypothetical protein